MILGIAILVLSSQSKSANPHDPAALESTISRVDLDIAQFSTYLDAQVMKIEKGETYIDLWANKTPLAFRLMDDVPLLNYAGPECDYWISREITLHPLANDYAPASPELLRLTAEVASNVHSLGDPKSVHLQQDVSR